MFEFWFAFDAQISESQRDEYDGTGLVLILGEKSGTN